MTLNAKIKTKREKLEEAFVNHDVMQIVITEDCYEVDFLETYNLEDVKRIAQKYFKYNNIYADNSFDKTVNKETTALRIYPERSM